MHLHVGTNPLFTFLSWVKKSLSRVVFCPTWVHCYYSQNLMHVSTSEWVLLFYIQEKSFPEIYIYHTCKNFLHFLYACSCCLIKSFFVCLITLSTWFWNFFVLQIVVDWIEWTFPLQFQQEQMGKSSNKSQITWVI